MKLEGKVCLITNCGEYMGPAIAKQFQQEGAILVLQTNDLNRAKDELARQGVNLPPIRFIEADFSKKGIAEVQITSLAAQMGGLDVLVNVNVNQPGKGKMLHEEEDESWETIIHSLMTELFFTCKAALKHMIPENRGKIVNVTSAAGVAGLPKYSIYSAARAGANGLTKALGKEVAPYNIQVNAIAQNFVENETYFPASLIRNEDVYKKIVKNIPIGRLAKGEESAKLAVFLASDDSDFLCGEVIKFAGGWG
ncbi:SDR family NAD(P)-dependent oxidoreductase [Ammoniphilus sp. 3BR4]|uniref:SDR family NAD(P)-dependent oxidoreductase n=1 Tax=Ammoniphilus sp. 3BR4 TaxID=3158265 RepID=UPI00346664A0